MIARGKANFVKFFNPLVYDQIVVIFCRMFFNTILTTEMSGVNGYNIYLVV